MKVDSTSQRDLDVVMALMDAVNAHDFEAFMATVTDDFVYDFRAAGFQPAHGREEMRATWDALLTVFPDVRESILGVQVREGLGVVHWEMSGTLSAPLPLGSRFAVPQPGVGVVTLRGVDVFTIRDGKIARKDTYADVGAWHEAYADLLVNPVAA